MLKPETESSMTIQLLPPLSPDESSVHPLKENPGDRTAKAPCMVDCDCGSCSQEERDYLEGYSAGSEDGFDDGYMGCGYNNEEIDESANDWGYRDGYMDGYNDAERAREREGSKARAHLQMT